MIRFPEKFNNLVDALSGFSGVGKRTATKMALHLFKNHDLAVNLELAIKEVANSIKSCPFCGNMTEAGLCNICLDDKRDKRLFCIVETVDDLINIENSDSFRGIYLVLGDHLSPLEGIGTDKLFVEPMLEKLRRNLIDEILIATNPDTNGENTALYIKELAKSYNVKITRIAYGIPFGVSLGYIDKTTLGKAIVGRSQF
ncbi:MAG: recombination protein RecR [bacterium]|nr:MAG: recombination protein RecR [bacterium]